MICKTGKLTFLTQADAERRMASMKASPTNKTFICNRVYQCELCRGWHMTSKPRIVHERKAMP